MKIKKEHGVYYIYLGKETFIHGYNQWSQIFGKYNWYNITLIEISSEKDDVCPGFEFTFILFGLGFRFRYNFDMESTEQGKDLKKRLNKIHDKK